jgi:signal transduction histidine kinase
MLIVPLVVGERTLGALSLLSLAHGHAPPLAETRLLAEQFALRAALALENARLYSAARRATKARDDVLAVVSHDLRNPLSSIATAARTLRESPPDDAERVSMLEAIGDATEWMNRLIHDLLDVSAIEAGRLAIVRHTASLADIVAAAITLVNGQAASRSLAIAADIPEGLPPVNVDAGRVTQVMGNLLSNALKFTEHGSITIRARLSAPNLVVDVQDTGIGIPLEEQARVFDRFWQARRTSRRGNGLGLAIARGIVEAHGGRIWVESEPARGSTFSFSIPIEANRG